MKPKSLSTHYNAKILLKSLKQFQFVLLLIFWDTILSKVNKVNLLLQEKATTVEKGAKMIKALTKNELQNYRNDFFDSLYNSAQGIAEILNIETSIQEKRRREIKKMSDETASDDSYNMNQATVLKNELYGVFDVILVQT